MPVIAVINRKGGSGKSTLATHLAAWCAHRGHPVMLGDVDRQQSSRHWLRLRDERGPAQRGSIVGWSTAPRQVLRPPPGVRHVVLDTPGGLCGSDLARLVIYADAILMPVCNSLFDRTSAAECHAELMSLPRVATGRCRLGAVGMRVDARTKSAYTLQRWAEGLGLPFVGVLRETQAYVRCIEQGLTLFDLPPSHVRPDLLQWQPILDWLEPVLDAPAPAVAAPRPMPQPALPARVSPAEGIQALEALITKRGHGALPPQRSRGGFFGWLGWPRLFQRHT
ncbi:MAG TPA: ParA family protein [Albitalea sp.]